MSEEAAKEMNSSWADVNDEQRLKYSAPVKEFLSEVKAETDRLDEHLNRAQLSLKESTRADGELMIATAQESALVQSIVGWTAEWRAEEESAEGPISRAHQAHTHRSEIVKRRIKETRRVIKALTAISARVQQSIDDTRSDENEAREQLERVRAENVKYDERANSIGALAEQLKQIEAGS